MLKSGWHVFIVDDDEPVRKSLKRLIQSIGLCPQIFASAREFLDSDYIDKPGCLILDVKMPVMSGFDLQQKLNEWNVAMPIIFITGHGNIPMSVKAMRAGAIDFLAKPFEEKDLIKSIQMAEDYYLKNKALLVEKNNIHKRFASLTKREKQVFHKVTAGLLNKQIAFQLGISEKTVKVHRARVMDKMEVNSLAELVRMAERQKYDG